jgi:hypothetical protein
MTLRKFLLTVSYSRIPSLPSTNRFPHSFSVAFVEGEHATETELKLKIIEIYNAKLDERERRKAFVIERGLLDYKRLLAVERRRPREEREVRFLFCARYVCASTERKHLNSSWRVMIRSMMPSARFLAS